MEVVERVGDRGEQLEDLGGGEPGTALAVDEVLQVGPVDPVEDECVALAVDEVVAHHGQRGVGAHAHEHARLGSKLGEVVAGPEGVHLEGDHALEVAVDGLEHGLRAALR